MFVRKVKKGIYIDLGCTSIIPINEGVFIPTECQTSESNPKFQEDLTAFLNKWFAGKNEGTKDCPSTTALHQN